MVVGGLVALLATVAAEKGSYLIRFETDVALPNSSSPSIFIINVTSALAPVGAEHMHALVNDNFFDGAAFFRVVPGFVVQFGIAGTPAENQKWRAPIKDDPVLGSNVAGTVTYAATSAPDSRTTQIFINLADNARLDSQGFAPFGTVVQGMDVVNAIFNPTPGSSTGVSQFEYETKGDAWIRDQYPGINFVLKASIMAPLPPSPSLSLT